VKKEVNGYGAERPRGGQSEEKKHLAGLELVVGWKGKKWQRRGAPTTGGIVSGGGGEIRQGDKKDGGGI